MVKIKRSSITWPIILAITLAIAVPLAWLAGERMANATYQRAHTSEQYQSVLRFCARFAEAVPSQLLQSSSTQLIPQSTPQWTQWVVGSVAVEQPALFDLVTYWSNLFQPKDSRFVSAWDCRFSLQATAPTTPPQTRVCQGQVSLPIAEHAAFAAHTSWPRLNFVEDNHITTQSGASVGYAVPKYYELECES